MFFRGFISTSPVSMPHNIILTFRLPRAQALKSCVPSFSLVYPFSSECKISFELTAAHSPSRHPGVSGIRSQSPGRVQSNNGNINGKMRHGMGSR